MSGVLGAANILKTLETSSSVGMFARDTGGCLISRLSLSRTPDESREISFAELTESAIFYFSSPALAKACAGVFGGKKNKDLISAPLEDLKNLSPESLKKVKLAKFSRIVSTFGIILPLVWGIAPVRNQITYSESGKDEFVSVVGLKKEEKKKHRKEAGKNTLNLVKKIGLVSVGIVGAGLGLAMASKNKSVYKKTEPFIDRTVKLLDFTKDGDLKLAHYGALIYPASIAGYFMASRDKYEVMENARRFSITVPLLFFGEKLIQNPIYNFFDKKFKTNVRDKNGDIKSYSEIFKMPEKKKLAHLKSKNFSYGLTFFTNTMLIAAAVALLNRVETKRKYRRVNMV